MFLILFLLLLLARVNGHGMMCEPRQRGAFVSSKCGSNLNLVQDPVIDYCAHCLNGGTVATTKSNLPPSGFHVYDPIGNFDLSATRAGLCGDVKGQNHHMLGGDFMPSRFTEVPFVAHYKSSAHIDFLAEIDTNHNGYFEFFLCNLDACNSTDIAPKCFKEGHCHRLLRVPHPDCQDKFRDTFYECGPIDTEYPGRWYLPCRNTGHVGVHLVGGPSGTMRYKLPDGVSCKHCVVQWYWSTANSCAPRGLLDYMKRENDPFGSTCKSDGGGLGTYRAGMQECKNNSVPEEFWSCADVQITENGRHAGPVQLVTGNDTENVMPDNAKNNFTDSDSDTRRVQEEGKKGMETNETNSADENDKEQQSAQEGQCFVEGEPCDGTIHCCNHSNVCVFRSGESRFACHKWWSLWQEKDWRDMLESENSV